MRSEQAVKKLEKQSEESMSPRDWAVLLADRVSACETLEEYCAAQAKAETWNAAPHFLPLATYHRMRLLGDTEALRAAELEYRVLCQLVLGVNQVLCQASILDEQRLGVAVGLYAMIRWCRGPEEDGDVGDAGKGCKGRTMDMPELALLAAVRLAELRSKLGALVLLSGERLAGRLFIVRSTLRRLRETEDGYDRLLHSARVCCPSATDKLPEKVQPTPASLRAVADAWLRDASEEVIERLHPDSERNWQAIRAICRGQRDIEIVFESGGQV
jgi:hypothetical protein